ncbi:hypothetical protein LCGC14_1881250 [marine sediment metagenome]|uniref:Uncharacterized protein n=1 Tax=marine sediment metagenome TaxID=412755 RepID=A0A0F9IG89_9ZZZZ
MSDEKVAAEEQPEVESEAQPEAPVVPDVVLRSVLIVTDGTKVELRQNQLSNLELKAACTDILGHLNRQQSK